MSRKTSAHVKPGAPPQADASGAARARRGDDRSIDHLIAPKRRLFGLLLGEQAARRLPCPSQYHEYDNPTLLEKYKREGKKAQLLC